jgi:uncharacterized phage protein gp47/JayE
MSSETVAVSFAMAEPDHHYALYNRALRTVTYPATATQLDEWAAAIGVAREVLRAREAARKRFEPIPPGTRVRYRKLAENAFEPVRWIYGTVAALDSIVFGGLTAGALQEPQHVWAYWDGDANTYPTYAMRANVTVVA